MSLNCLTCQSLQRTDSDHSCRTPKEKFYNFCFLGAERNWSGPLMSPPYEHFRDDSGPSSRKRQKGERRLSTGAVVFAGSDLGVSTGGGGSGLEQPKLIRSGGMRRDWSFEDLRQIRREGKRKERR